MTRETFNQKESFKNIAFIYLLPICFHIYTIVEAGVSGSVGGILFGIGLFFFSSFMVLITFLSLRLKSSFFQEMKGKIQNEKSWEKFSENFGHYLAYATLPTALISLTEENMLLLVLATIFLAILYIIYLILDAVDSSIDCNFHNCNLDEQKEMSNSNFGLMMFFILVDVAILLSSLICINEGVFRPVYIFYMTIGSVILVINVIEFSISIYAKCKGNSLKFLKVILFVRKVFFLLFILSIILIFGLSQDLEGTKNPLIFVVLLLFTDAFALRRKYFNDLQSFFIYCLSGKSVKTEDSNLKPRNQPSTDNNGSYYYF